MGIFNKFKDLFKNKKSTVEKIKEKRSNEAFIEQTKFDKGLKKSSNSLNNLLANISKEFVKVDQDLIDNIEESLISFDIGNHSTQKILDSIINEIKFQNINDPKLIKQIIIDKLFVYYIQNTDIDTTIKLRKNETNVILVSGVNGVGKTTSIAKIANKFKTEGFKILLIAADTFRAGAVEQLKIWANKLDIEIITPELQNQDPTSLIFKGLEYSKNKKFDIIVCDTSGRMQNKVNLMNELKKMHGVIQKSYPNQPVESLLVLDATTGQNGIAQAKVFKEITNITGVILTKMDSSSKGGLVMAIKDAFNIPVKFICFGENLTDIEEFDLEKYIQSLLAEIKI
ncbi:MAG: signal recognition particle-docking protein FtsY [Mycoplasmataceae bacterium]|nr:signal recognition particle-docking protein FtsY [Mycoplasmataceae bacterium]